MPEADRSARWRPTQELGWEATTAGYIDGDHRAETTPELLEIEDPGDAVSLGTLGEAGASMVDEAVLSADRCFRSDWRHRAPGERAETLARVATELASEAELLAKLESIDTGKPVSQAAGDVAVSVRYFEYYASLADKMAGTTIPAPDGEFTFTVLEPLGVVGHITPWNAPLSQMVRGVAPSLCAGNTVVVKPSELTPLTTLFAAELFTRAGLPPGACNVVIGRGPTTGSSLVDHPSIAHVTFTGSVATGRVVGQAAAERIVGCNLELGGKSPTIVFPDADVEAAAHAAANAVIRNSGQSCFATTRQIVHERVHDEFVERLVLKVAQLRVGHGLDDPDLGPLVSAGHRQRVEELVASGVAEGAEIVAGGTRPRTDLPGYFYAPTVLVNVDNSFRVAREEVFGPVQTVLSFSDEAEAVATANDSDYGLSAGVFTKDLSTAHRVASQLEAGQVQVNRYRGGGVNVPFGGYKQSGLGREKGTEALRHYTQVKSVLMAI